MSAIVNSFSITNEEDKEFIHQLKVYCRKTGMSLSWMIIQALKEYTEKQKIRIGKEITHV